MLIGLEVDESVCAKALNLAFLREGILTKETRARTFRFAPPLTIEEDDVHEIVQTNRPRARGHVVATRPSATRRADGGERRGSP